MLADLRLYGRYLGISIRSQLQYRASFIMMAGGHFLITSFEFAAIWVLFERFGGLADWSLAEVALFYGMVNVSFALAEATARSFEYFHTLVKSGDFDRFLLRPCSLVIQVAGQEIHLRRLGRLTQGLCILAWAALALKLDWTLAKTGLLAFSIVGGTCLFYALFIIQATMTFGTTETLELMNSVTNDGTFTAQYPITIYCTWLRRFFTYAVPLACVSYYPALALLDRPDALGFGRLFQWLAPGIGILFFIFYLRLWHWGVLHYRSTGS
jgi:ABC-2 type transport system permease protein